MDVIIACHIYEIQIRKRKSLYWNYFITKIEEG
jgi:hypothetical protein